MAIFANKPKTINKVVLVPISSIIPNPNQPRREFDSASIDTLAESIARNGLLNPISLRFGISGEYILVAGERRLMACKRLGMSEIPAIIENRNNQSSAVLALVENMHRKELNCIEEAEGIYTLLTECELSQSRICSLLSLSQPAVSNKLRLLRLSPPVRNAVVEYKLGERIARALLALADEQSRLSAAQYIANRHLTVSQAENYINSLVKNNAPRRSSGILRDYRIIFSTVDKAVKEIRKAGINVLTAKKEEDEFICYSIRIPKNKRPSEDTLPAEQLNLFSIGNLDTAFQELPDEAVFPDNVSSFSEACPLHFEISDDSPFEPSPA